MKITNVLLNNFKRFTNLKIDNVPASSKLVVVIGSNGSGKSSLFDAFGFFDSSIKNDVAINDDYWNYFRKRKDSPMSVSISFNDNSSYTLGSNHFTKPGLSPQTFYGRTSFRQIPRLTRTGLGQGTKLDFEKDSDRPRYFIERDNRFENDIEKITEIILRDFFRSKESNEQIRNKYINPINRSLKNIFGEGSGTKLELIEIIPPLEGKIAQITFRKGDSEIHYNYLSAGEKEVFNLLVNFLSRGSLYHDTIFYFDEIDLHLNTKLQFNLIKEITENWIPDNCQLWTATHSLGFIEYAKQSEQASTLDFDELNFDLPQTLIPESKDNPEVYEIAVGKEFLPALFRQMSVYFVENKDRDYYASIGVPNTVFVSDNNRNNVFHKVKATNFYGIVDRDFLSDDDIKEIRRQYPNLRILNYYSIENYMFHPDNLEEYYSTQTKVFNKGEYIKDLIEAKNQARDLIVLQITIARCGYPYFGEPDFNGTALQKRFKNAQENLDQSAKIQANLNSNELETFYTSLPMKTYCTNLSQRQNAPRFDLVKTNWFKTKIQAIL